MLKLIFFISFLRYGFLNANYLEAESNYLKPKLERNNIVNKGVWIKNKNNDNLFQRSNLGHFIFGENSLEADNLLQNNFDAFGENFMQDLPIVSSYVERAKRSTNHKRKRDGKSIKKCKNGNCKKVKVSDVTEENAISVAPEVIPNLRPASVFNDYPYEVAILLSNNEDKYHKNIPSDEGEKKSINSTVNNKDNSKFTEYSANDLESNSEKSNKTSTKAPKRSTQHYENEIIKKLELTETNNKTDGSGSKRNLFEKDDKVWHQNAPVLEKNHVYKVVPKGQERNKPVTERGLIKVISMLTKTFKKIMKQHNDIKDIYNKINNINENFVKKIDDIQSKFQDFDLKYAYLRTFNDKLKSFEMRLNNQVEYFRDKEKEIAENLIGFGNQQKKFLAQQHQFYNIQKVMLAQNEKINIKQNLIAKTQSEISHRQNNFARILKKAKELYTDSKYPTVSKITTMAKLEDKNNNNESQIVDVKISESTTTESVKIDLFSIPTLNRPGNQDELIIKDKDKPIDDVVYKYYFNNTYLDNLMKNKILANYITSPENAEIARNTKSKRNGIKSTILLPVNKNNVKDNFINLKRERRWINHHSRKKNRRKNRGKESVTILDTDDEKSVRQYKIKRELEDLSIIKKTKELNTTDPFLTMATSFCKEVGQNKSEQILNWCIEKALRRLQNIDLKQLLPPSTYHEEQIKKQTLEKEKRNKEETNHKTSPVGAESTVPSESKIFTPSAAKEETTKTSPNTVLDNTLDHTIFFPDNDELESNLNQYDLTKDTEGNVYYDGSVHTSDIVTSDSEGFSDIIPGMDSNSRVELSPLALDLQARRRAYVQRFNADITRRLG